MSDAFEYKCPNCGGALSFDINAQKCVCPYCDAEFDVNEVKGLNEVKEVKEDLTWDESGLKEYSQEELNTLNEFHCNSCGAVIVADENTSATSCPYCENPVILTGRLTGALKPDYVIPFKLDDEAAKKMMSKYLNKKLFLPKVFKDQNKIEEIKGIYVPFWIYDADAEGRVTYKGMIKNTYTKGEYKYTEYKYYSIIRDGSLGFRHIPVDGSSSLDDKLMESIEPFDFSEAVSFEAAYLSGHLSDKYDVDKEACRGRANQRVKEGTIQKFRTTVSKKYNEVEYDDSQISLYNTSVKYALYPVWLLNTKWNDKSFHFAMNGETGKFTGNLPISKLKYLLWFFIMFIGVSFATALTLFLFIQDTEELPFLILIGLFIGLVVAIIFCRKHRKKLKPVMLNYGASSYYKDGSMNITYSRDFYLYKKVDKTKISK